jgi:hypothetical protein
MPIFLAVLVIFMAATPGHPASVQLVGFTASNVDACRVELALAVDTIAQRPGVSDVEPLGCVTVANPKEKAA